jgi:hypothetical protein
MKSFVLLCSIVISAISCSKKAAAPSSGSAASGSATAPATGSAAAPATGSATTPTTGSAASGSAASGSGSAAVALPKETDIKQGEEAWAVYFAVGAVDAKEFVAAKTRTEAMGLTLHHKDRGCDVTPDSTAKDGDMLLSAYYSSEADAKLVATAFGQPAPWVGKVKTMCLD